MTNNDILRRLRYTFDFSNKKAVELFSLDPSSTIAISEGQFTSKLAKEEDAEFIIDVKKQTIDLTINRLIYESYSIVREW